MTSLLSRASAPEFSLAILPFPRALADQSSTTVLLDTAALHEHFQGCCTIIKPVDPLADDIGGAYECYFRQYNSDDEEACDWIDTCFETQVEPDWSPDGKRCVVDQTCVPYLEEDYEDLDDASPMQCSIDEDSGVMGRPSPVKLVVMALGVLGVIGALF